MYQARNPLRNPASQLEQMHNYYERLVLEALSARRLEIDDDSLTDIACIALNELPAKYIRHEVDMAYYTDPTEIAAMHGRVARAVDMAVGRVLCTRLAKPA
ncbi:MAG: late competence development ComFB family protein [Gammaproteobacteria bacterium]